MSKLKLGILSSKSERVSSIISNIYKIVYEIEISSNYY